jgi:threonine-phosphate decarboxylase
MHGRKNTGSVYLQPQAGSQVNGKLIAERSRHLAQFPKNLLTEKVPYQKVSPMQSSDPERPRHGGDLTLARSNFARNQLIDFSANMNPLGPPQAAWQALLDNLPGIVNYPDPYARGLKTALAAHLRVEPDNLALGNGSIELIYLLPRVFPQATALVPAPGFSEYDYAVRLTSSQCRYIYLQPPDYAWDLPALLAEIAQGGLIFLCNPNNPTGTLLSGADLEAVLAALPDSALLVMDEAFIDFVDKQEELTLVPRAIQDPRVLVLGSLTKFFALPGLRLGYLAGTPERLRKLAAFLPPWNINSLAQAAGAAALGEAQYIEHSRKYIREARDLLFAALKDIPGLNPLPPTANFIFCRLGEELPNAPRMVELLGRQGFLLRDCSNYRGLDDRCLRLAVRRRQDNFNLVAALTEICTHGG